MRHNSPCGVLNRQLRFVLGAFTYGQTLFHLLEIGFDIFLYSRERWTSSESANDLLPKANTNIVYRGLKASMSKQSSLKVGTTHINNRELVSNVLMTSKVSDILL